MQGTTYLEVPGEPTAKATRGRGQGVRGVVEGRVAGIGRTLSSIA